MIKPVDIRINDVVYKVTEHNDFFNRNKIKMTDAQGVEWFRYDRPIRRWTVSEYQLQGIVSIAVIGTVKDPDVYTDTYHFQDTSTGKILEFDDDDQDLWDKFYRSRAEAELTVDQLKAQLEQETRDE